jgi:hypothetical protein
MRGARLSVSTQFKILNGLVLLSGSVAVLVLLCYALAYKRTLWIPMGAFVGLVVPWALMHGRLVRRSLLRAAHEAEQEPSLPMCVRQLPHRSLV